MNYPETIWDGKGPRRVANQFSEPSPEDWNKIVAETTALQEAVGIKSDWPLRGSNLGRATKTSLRAEYLKSEDEEIRARRIGLSYRQVSIPLPAINAGGAVSAGLWIPSKKAVITDISVAYLTVPSSALGTIVADINKVSGGTTTLLQATASFDLKAITNALPASIVLKAKTIRTIQAGDYIYVTITSDNADAVDGTAGVIVITYNSF